MVCPAPKSLYASHVTAVFRGPLVPNRGAHHPLGVTLATITLASVIEYEAIPGASTLASGGDHARLSIRFGDSNDSAVGALGATRSTGIPWRNGYRRRKTSGVASVGERSLRRSDLTLRQIHDDRAPRARNQQGQRRSSCHEATGPVQLPLLLSIRTPEKYSRGRGMRAQGFSPG